jgi:enoyl-CoA hydratase/carnithine racemase
MERNIKDEVRVHKSGHVSVVEINRPPHNFTDIELITHLANTIENLSSDVNSVRCLVLCSTGTTFSAGADFSQGGVGGDGDFKDSTRQFYSQAVRILCCEVPIVVAVQGPAIGAGLGLALCGDVRIGSSNAKFGAPFVRLGIHPGFGISYTLAKLIGTTAASQMLLTAERVRADKALELGLISEITEEKDLRSRAIAIATQIAENAPLALRSTKKTLKADIHENIAKVLEHELQEQANLIETEDAKEGIIASIQRRIPDFKGI